MAALKNGWKLAAMGFEPTDSRDVAATPMKSIRKKDTRNMTAMPLVPIGIRFILSRKPPAIAIIPLILPLLAFGQQTTTRLDVVYSGSTPGRIRSFEEGLPKSNYIDLIAPSSLAANYTLTLPKTTSTLLAQINYHYSDSQAFPISAWRARGTEASPTDLSSGDPIYQFVGIGRVGGTWISLGTFGMDYYSIGGVDVGWINFATRNAGVVGTKVSITHTGQILPGSTAAQDIGSTGTGYWRSIYLGSGTPAYMDRASITTAQRALFTIAGSTSGSGVWGIGVGPNSSQSQFEIVHNSTAVMRFTQGAGIYSLDAFYPNTTNTYALGSPTLQWNNLYVNFIDVEGDVQPKTNNTVPLGSSSLRFSKLWVTDIDCSGTCPGDSPPVDWHLDISQHVLTLGSHLAGGAFQLLMKHSRGTNASPTDTLDNDRIGQIAFQLYGSGYQDAAAIRVEADGIPSGTSSPARIGFFVTQAASTTPVERMFIQQDGETWLKSSMTSDRLLYLQNDSSSGYSTAAFLDHTGNVKGMVGWHNSAAAVHASLFIVGTRTNDLVALVQNDTARWTLSSSSLNPVTDGGQSIGSSALKPAAITSQSFFTETGAAYGTQQNTLSADANLNLSLVAASSAAATDRASLQFYRYRNTAASPTAVVNGDRLGVMAWQGYTGAGGLMPGAVIESYVNATVSSGVLPAELRFRTTNSSGTLADRAVLNANGFTLTGGILPTPTGTWSLGGGSNIWANLFTNYLTVTNTAGFGVVGHFVPYLDNTNDLGGSSYQWKTVHARNFDAYNEFALISSSITRFLVSASSLATFDGSGNTTFTLTTSSGAVSSRAIAPQTDNTYDLGDFAHQWKDLYVANDILIGTGGGIRAPDNNYGLSYTATFRNSAGTGTCTVTFSAGIATNTTC